MNALLLNDERTVLVRIYLNGQAEVCTRETSDHVWGPPVQVCPESPEDRTMFALALLAPEAER